MTEETLYPCRFCGSHENFFMKYSIFCACCLANVEIKESEEILELDGRTLNKGSLHHHNILKKYWNLRNGKNNPFMDMEEKK